MPHHDEQRQQHIEQQRRRGGARSPAVLILRFLVCASLLSVSAVGLWAALRARQRDLQLGAIAAAVASLLLVYFVLYKPAGVTKPDIVPGTLQEEPQEEPDE